VASDPSALNTNVQAVVSAYNAVIGAIHADAGYGTNPANNPNLASNTTLRSIASSLANTMEGVFGTGRYQGLADVGVTLQQDGTLAVDTTKLDAAFTADPTTVEKLFGRDPLSSKGGAMASLRDLADSITTASIGMLAVASQSFTDQSNRLTTSIATQQQHIDAYQAQLQAEFSAMETQYSANQTLLTQLSKMSTTTTG
jgi:flagellar hook-associated protein 2